VHRTGLTRMLTAIQGMAGEAFINRLVGDPAIRFLLMSYELLAVDRRIMAEEVLDSVRGSLHQEGVDVEIVEVVGGVVYVRLHGAEELYVSGYTAEALDHWAGLARCRRADGLDVYVYFDNDAKVHAPYDALALIERVTAAGV